MIATEKGNGSMGILKGPWVIGNEKQTQEERPLERIIGMKENREGITLSATTEHLVARIGKSVQRDYGGTLDLRYAPEDKFAFVHWHRDI